MKKFHGFIYPDTNEGLMASASKYYIGSFDDYGDVQRFVPLVPHAYCEILKTMPDGSLKLFKSGFVENDHWIWTPLSVLDGT